MSTIHLVYSSLKRVLNADIYDSNKIILIKREKKIKQILSECCSLPSVIDDIIFKYTDSKIIIPAWMNEQFYGSTYALTLHDIYGSSMTININKINNNIAFRTDFYSKDTNIINSDKRVNLNCITHFNTFMKKEYNKDNYINCPRSYVPEHTCVMSKNNITFTYELHTFQNNNMFIKDYKKFTYLIVILKCIINGIQRYLKT